MIKRGKQMSLKKFNASKDKPTNDDEQCNSGSKPSTAQSYTHLQDKCHVSLVMFEGRCTDFNCDFKSVFQFILQRARQAFHACAGTYPEWITLLRISFHSKITLLERTKRNQKASKSFMCLKSVNT